MNSIEISKNSFLNYEEIGTRAKAWLKYDNNIHLFKQNLRDTGEDWSEVVAAKFCNFLGLPHAEYYLAHLAETGERGVLTKNFVDAGKNLILGNALLFRKDNSYPVDERRQYKLSEHTIYAISQVIKKLKPPLQFESVGLTAVDFFAGYLFLDTIIGNTDRHHQNWGAIEYQQINYLAPKINYLAPKINYLAPTFDHASSFAHTITDSEKSNRISTNDEGHSVKSFAKRAKSAIYQDVDSTSTLTTIQTYIQFCSCNKVSLNLWNNKLADINRGIISDILNMVSSEFMTDASRSFTIEYIMANLENLYNECE